MGKNVNGVSREASSSGALTIDAGAVTTSSLKALQSDDQRKVMDIVDKLRRTGLSGVVGLPQLVVCGDQSSGKSSVLEAITEIPFPRKENLCTRFATEIILRRSTSSTIQITINADKNRSDEEKAKLGSFKKSITDFTQLPDIIEDATHAMGLGRVGEINSRAFSRDVLSVEICGPDRPQLTLVDLPGLIHATNKAQTQADKELILDLVLEYMKNPRTIILAVVSAKNDFANQVILDHCKSVDKKGARTLGIVTKPDYLREGSQNEADWIELAQNKNIYFKLGWHMLRNRSDREMDYTFAERNETEKLFFEKGRYNELPRDTVGIDPLRQRLSKLLLDHLIKELPSLKEEMATKLAETRNAIEGLGEKRTTVEEQRTTVMRISMTVHDILKSAVKGSYDNDFFGSIDRSAPVDSKKNIRRLRAVVQHLNMQFAQDMRLKGHKYALARHQGEYYWETDTDGEEEVTSNESAEGDVPGSPKHSEKGSVAHKPKYLSRKEAIEWVQEILQRSRGFELPGNFNPMLISQLFWEQSQPWEQLALRHIETVAQKCKQFVYEVLAHTAPAEFQAPLCSLSVDAALQGAVNHCTDELRRIIADKSNHPMTYNHYFTTTIQKMRQRKHASITQQAHSQAEKTITWKDETKSTLLEPEKLQQAILDNFEQDMDKFCAEEALGNQRAYYKDEMKYFVNAVCKAAVERHLVKPLPDIILSPLVVAQFTNKEVEFIAAEPPEITQQRAYLENRKMMLEMGMETFREAMGGLRR